MYDLRIDKSIKYYFIVVNNIRDISINTTLGKINRTWSTHRIILIKVGCVIRLHDASVKQKHAAGVAAKVLSIEFIMM